MVSQGFSLILSQGISYCLESGNHAMNFMQDYGITRIFAHADVKALRALFSWDLSTFLFIPELTFLLLFSQPQVT